MLTICIDLLFLQPDRNKGTETYIRELLREFDSNPSLAITLVMNRAVKSNFPESQRARRVVARISGLDRVARVIYQQARLSDIAARTGADVLFCPGYLSPLWPKLPTVVTIHDTQFRDFPHSISWGQRFIYNLVIPRAARRAAKVIAVSEFSRTRIQRELGIPRDNIAVIYSAPKRLPVSPEATRPCRNDLSGERYFLSVSSGLAHKNVAGLLSGFRRFKERYSPSPVLVLAGQTMGDLRRLRLDPGPDVRVLGHVPNAELAELYSNAHGFVLASLYEGFGLPVLEAMQHGIPVACSNAASLPEIAGQGTLLFNPLDPEAICEALRVLAFDQRRRAALVAAGYVNLKRFSWRRCAEETLAVLEGAAAAQSPRVAGQQS
ncbi:MAG: glycosyltransferase family 4 protein [Verrucomicrobiia bacterium]